MTSKTTKELTQSTCGQPGTNTAPMHRVRYVTMELTWNFFFTDKKKETNAN